MPRYFFDVTDGGPRRDDTGTDCVDDQAMRRAAMDLLPSIAREEIPTDGDRRHFTIVVRDENERVVYTAALSFVGQWLRERPGEAA